MPDRWGHPWVSDNTLWTNRGANKACKHCRICRARAARAGVTLAQYYALHPETLRYNGFPVAGAKVGRTSGKG